MFPGILMTFRMDGSKMHDTEIASTSLLSITHSLVVHPSTMSSSGLPSSSGPNPPLYSYSTNTSTSTVSQVPRSLIDSRGSPRPQSGLGQQQPLLPPAGANILERPLNKTKGAEVSLSAWSFLFAEIVAYSQSRVDSVADLEKR